MTRGNPSSLFRLIVARTPGTLAAALVLACALGAARPATAQSAASWNKRGEAAELRQDYDTAYEAYRNAHQKNPKDMRYQARLDRMRFQAAAQHVDRGRVLRQNGDVPGALNQFSRALQIDPSNEAAQQEIKLTEQSEKIPGAIPVPPSGTTSSSSVVQEVSRVAAPVELKPVSSDLVSLTMASEDTKVIYQAVAKFAGLNVMFDPDYTSRRIAVNLNNVSLSEALRVVGVLSGTFYTALTQDTIYVAQDTPDKHAQLDQQAVQTFYLTNATAQAEINEIAQALRQILPADTDKLMVLASQSAIVMRAPPAHLLLAEKILNDLDRTKPEVVVDVAILEVNRDKVRSLGISLPQTFTVTPQVTPNSTNTANSATSGTALASAFTLNTLANINATNFAVTIGSGTVNALLTDADTRVLQNPSLRATDGKEAVLKIGSKIPIATGSYNAGVATGVASIGVQTQFQYQDVGVTIDMTPQIKLDREISLALDVTDSTEAGTQVLEGVAEPIFGNREAKTTIQLRDGEPCLLAGMLSKEDDSSLSGTPGLASIPLLKYVFGSTTKEVKQGEIVFILVPHIVRESILTRLNTRAIDTGTGRAIQLRQLDAPAADALLPENAVSTVKSNMTAAQGADAMIPQLAQQATRTPGATPATPAVVPGAATPPPAPIAPQTPPAVQAPAQQPANAPLQPISFSIAPVSATQAVGTDFVATVSLANARDVYSVPVQLQFDPKVLQLTNVDSGGLLSGDGQPVTLVHRDEGNGTVIVSASRPPGAGGITVASGQLCVLHFRAVAAGDSSIALARFSATNSAGTNLPATGAAAVVHVR